MNYIEAIILRNLQFNEDFTRKVIPYLKPEYFSDPSERAFFGIVHDFFQQYNALPDNSAMEIAIQKRKLTEEQYKNLSAFASDVQETYDKKKDKEQLDWLLENTEEFCKDKALYNALSEALIVAKGDDKGNLSKTGIPDILNEALGVSFDSNVGHSYLDNSDSRFDFYNRKTVKIASHLDMLNRITNGGCERKTVNCVAAGTGVGKSMILCDLAANYMKAGYQVLYITNEMAEEKIAQRVDANLMNIDIARIDKMAKDKWDDKVDRIKKLCTGKLTIKEYPTSTAHTGHFKFLLRELKQKQNFIPDVIIVDYLNICTSARYKDKANSYGYVKSICEELRGFAVEANVMLWTATQLNRDGIDNSDVDLKNISESMGGPMTFDFLIALISNEDLANMGQVLVKQLKNRYADLFKFNKFNLGVDRNKMKFYDLAAPTSNSTNTTRPQTNNTVPTGNRNSQNKKRNFANIKVS